MQFPRADDEKQALAELICAMLTMHATVEEEISRRPRGPRPPGPARRKAEVEHATAKDLIKQIQSMEPGDELHDAKVKVLGEYTTQHAQEEEGELFPECRSADMDLGDLGEEILSRKTELMEELA